LLEGGFVDFSTFFTYLGSDTWYDLIDSPDIKKRKSKASQAMGLLSNIWRNQFIELKTKHSFFLAIPINLLLWGCEAWALKESDFDRLDTFFHRSIRRILGINMMKVREERIKNEEVRKEFFNTHDICSTMIAARQPNYIGKVICHPNPNHLPLQLLSAWVNHKRPRGGPLTTNTNQSSKH
jgi:hypothetical protein